MAIPRLELVAFYLGAKILRFLKKELRIPIATMTLFTDATCVLDWLLSDKPQPVFIENRLAAIREILGIIYRYIRTQENPADLATRNNRSFTEIATSNLWWGGPEWLQKEMKDWPNFEVPVIDEKVLKVADEKAEKSGDRMMFQMSYSATDSPSEAGLVEGRLGAVLDLKKFSTLGRLVRTTAWMLRFIFRGRQLPEPKKETYLTCMDTTRTRWMWVREVQRKEFPGLRHFLESWKLRGEKEKEKVPSEYIRKWLQFAKQLNLTLDENGVICCVGRFEHSDLPKQTKCPQLLPRGSWLTRLIVEDCHRRLLHAGLEQTLAMVRKQYWIPRGRVEVRWILHECQVCRAVEGGPYRLPKMPSWPRERVSQSNPFTFVGVDYFGPVLVFSRDGVVQKIWVVLFTCMSIRAVHLEMVYDMTTQSFLNALDMFISTRGLPKCLVSDNALQFRLANRVLNDKSIQWEEHCVQRGILWKYIPELSPWAGGFYERMVGLVKRCLRKSIGRLRLTAEEFRVYLAKAGVLVNSRPLTYVGSDLNRGRVLSPSDFLTQNSPVGLLPQIREDDGDPDYSESKDSAKCLLDLWQKQQKEMEGFWKLFYNEYLPSLRERKELEFRRAKRSVPQEPEVGDIVLLLEKLRPRADWRIGKVQEILPSRDDKIRAVRVLLPNGHCVVRSPKLLYPLECPNMDQEQYSEQEQDDEGQAEDGEDGELKQRPVRQAKQKAQKAIADYYKDDVDGAQATTAFVGVSRTQFPRMEAIVDFAVELCNISVQLL